MPREQLIATAQRVYRSFGFSPIDTPALEYLEILTGKGSDETDKQLYKFEDHGGRWVGLRFDLTVPLARFAAAMVPHLMCVNLDGLTPGGPMITVPSRDTSRISAFSGGDPIVIRHGWPETDDDRCVASFFSLRESFGAGAVFQQLTNARALHGFPPLNVTPMR